MPKRQALRQRYGLQEDCNDCVATTCCAPCAVCQEARELKFRSAPSGGRWIYKEFAYISLNIFFIFLGPVPVIVQPMGGNLYPSLGQPGMTHGQYQ
jgi:hypothetical protein